MALGSDGKGDEDLDGMEVEADADEMHTEPLREDRPESAVQAQGQDDKPNHLQAAPPGAQHQRRSARTTQNTKKTHPALAAFATCQVCEQQFPFDQMAKNATICKPDKNAWDAVLSEAIRHDREGLHSGQNEKWAFWAFPKESIIIAGLRNARPRIAVQ